MLPLSNYIILVCSENPEKCDTASGDWIILTVLLVLVIAALIALDNRR